MLIITILSILIASTNPADLPAKYYLQLARCNALCLSEFGVSNDGYSHLSIAAGSKTNCGIDCTVCSFACGRYVALSEFNCDRQCSGEQKPLACLYGCRRMFEITQKSSGSPVTKHTLSPVARVRHLCSNFDPNLNITSGRFRSDLIDHPVKLERQLPLYVYIYEIRYTNNASWNLFGMETNLIFTRRLPPSRYQLRVFAVSVDGLVSSQAVQSDWTDPILMNGSPMSPLSLSISHQRSDNAGEMSALMTWKPNPSYPTCFYELEWSVDDILQTDTITIIKESTYMIRTLRYNSNYTIMIKALSSLALQRKESPVVFTEFRTPACLELARFNLDICAPGSISNLAVSLYSNGTAVVQWRQPPYVTSVNRLVGYAIEWCLLTNLAKCDHQQNATIALNETSSSFMLDQLVPNCYYNIGIAAQSKGGTGPFQWIQFQYKFTNTITIQRSDAMITHYSIIYWSVGVTFFIMIWAIMIAVAIARRLKRRKIFSRPRRSLIVRSLESRTFSKKVFNSVKSNKKFLSNMGIRDFSNQIVLRRRIGSGAFGKIYEAQCMAVGLPNTVAVKLLKNMDDKSAEMQMRQEIELMKRLRNPHPHVVRIFGVLSALDGFVMEYWTDGNLKQYLKNEVLAKMVVLGEDGILDQTILLSYACQICRGVQFLHDQQLTHRDLAARNIVVTDGGETLKISDFGLCRVSKTGEFQVALSSSILPMKWMAPESIFDGIFSCKSDVWSFGILLWELVTLGDDPYADVTLTQLPELLQSSFRMSKPEHCSENMFRLMSWCWSETEEGRPTFGDIHNLLLAMMACMGDYFVS